LINALFHTDGKLGVMSEAAILLKEAPRHALSPACNIKRAYLDYPHISETFHPSRGL